MESDDALRCKYCCELFTDPVVLACGHSACSACYASVLARLGACTGAAERNMLVALASTQVVDEASGRSLLHHAILACNGRASSASAAMWPRIQVVAVAGCPRVRNALRGLLRVAPTDMDVSYEDPETISKLGGHSRPLR
eukprot:m51a1_g11515 hypothetical protein (140) ;mRNA; r:7782-12822